MDSEKYIGLDVHQATIVVAVMDSAGKLVMESILETKAATILQFFAGLRGTLWVTFEEGTWSAWLCDLLNPHVDKLVVCNPRLSETLESGCTVYEQCSHAPCASTKELWKNGNKAVRSRILRLPLSFFWSADTPIL
jgi:hypothetical protein